MMRVWSGVIFRTRIETEVVDLVVYLKTDDGYDNPLLCESSVCIFVHSFLIYWCVRCVWRGEWLWFLSVHMVFSGDIITRSSAVALFFLPILIYECVVFEWNVLKYHTLIN